MHEPPAGPLSWDACSYPGAPVVGTFHAYSTKPLLNHVATLAGARRKFNQLAGRIAVSEAAAWTGKRWFGGRYDVIPNGVDVERAAGRPEAAERRAAAALRRAPRGAQGPARAAERVRGAGRARGHHAHRGRRRRRATSPGTSPTGGAHDRIEALGRVSADELWRASTSADVLCAPSLAGESFGMVLTEAFAAGTPVIASEIAGYTDVVTDGVDGVLVPPADPQRFAEELQALSLDPQRLARDGPRGARDGPALRLAAGRRGGRGRLPRGDRGAEPRTASEADLAPGRHSARPTAAERAPPAGCRASTLPRRSPVAATGPRAGSRLGVAGALGVGLTFLAAQRIGVDRVVTSIVRSDIGWVLIATALMMASMFLRASSWFAIARAALPRPPAAPPRRHLRDDDRGADVGDPAGPPRRAGARDGARAAHRPDAGDVPGAAGHPGLADRAQHRSRWCCWA